MKLPLILLLVASAAKQAIAEAGNHFYTTNPNGEGIGADEYHLEGPACWTPPGGTPGTVPIYRWYNTASGDHLWSLFDSADGQVDAAAGYHLEGIAYYVFDGTQAQPAGTTPFWVFETKTEFNAGAFPVNAFWTIDEQEGFNANFDVLGWNGFVYGTDVAGSVELDRWYNG